MMTLEGCCCAAAAAGCMGASAVATTASLDGALDAAAAILA